MKLIKWLFWASLAFILNSCIDEIKLDIDKDQQHLVVDGQIADSLQVYTIKVSYSAIIGVGNDNIQTPVPGATVKVLDDTGDSFDFTESSPGVYTKEMKGEVGRAYHVEVKTTEGKVIMSRPTVLKASPPLLPPSAGIEQSTTISSNGRAVNTNKLALKMNTDVTGMADRPYLRWQATGEYEFKENYPGALNTKTCFIKNNVDINNIKVFDTHQITSGLLTDEPFLQTDYNYRFAFQFCFHLFQYSISEDEYNYWESVRSIVNIDGSLFDPPPGTVQGNLYNPNDPEDQILGYFSVAGVAYRRQFMDAISLSFYVEPKCSSLSFKPQYSECRECTEITNSSLVKPSYWIP
ncbi:MAG: DUF4249 family protein [Bacteroidetes bacterium]|nr:DUF4249 family protein [Bacteroidota bacterium]